MKIVKWLVAIVMALVAVLFVGGMLLSPKFTVKRELQIQAPPDKVYALVADPREWRAWSAWNKRDPLMEIVYTGPASGAGAAWAWKSQSQGDGKMTFTAAEPNQRLAYDLYFPDFGTTSTGELMMEPMPGGTRVVWTMNGDMGKNPLFHWMALMADRMVGEDFEAGLAGLKALAEKT